jgi:endonuclease G
MPKKSFHPLFFLKPSWLLTLFLGIVLGIASQRIPEIKIYTDNVIQPIEKSGFVKQLKDKITYYTETYPKVEQQETYTYQYTEQKPLPGQPISSFLIHRPGYSLAYDARNRNPLWVYEHLTAESVRGEADRPHANFREDDNIPQPLRATLADYRGHGLDPGFMAPAEDFRSNQEVMNDTLYLTNLCPQCPQLTRGYWAKLENHIRDLAKTHKNVYVTTGPLYLPFDDKEGRFVKYRVIGSNDVAIPSHFFKVIVLEDWQGKKETLAYILPNYEIPLNTSLDNFRTTVQKVEKAAGMILPHP